MTRLALALCTLCLLSACNVATVDQAPSTVAQNECTSDSDCAGGVCSNSQCRSRSGTLQNVLFEVTPPADHSPIAGVQYLKSLVLPPAGGDISLDLDAVSQIVGEVLLGDVKCATKFVDGDDRLLATSGDASVPAVVSLTPSSTALGLYSPRAVAKSELTKMSYFSFSVNVPPGDYDVYIEPGHQLDETCPVPPHLRRRQQIKGGAYTLYIPLPKPSTFDFHVAWPLGDGALNGWFVDMLDPVSGRVLSNRVKLALSDVAKTDYSARLSYTSVVVGDTSGETAEELVRLSPPDGVTAPTILLARSALGLFDADRGTLNQFTALPTPVHVQGQVTKLVTPKPIATTVTLIAKEIAGVDPGVFPSFVRTVNVGKDGQFELDLLPGTYSVSAVPAVELNGLSMDGDDARFAQGSQEWSIASSPSNQAGKVIALGPALPINGNVRNAAGTIPVATALVQAVPSPSSIQTDVLHQALGETGYVPRASTTSVTAQGDFVLIADSGTFDVTVRPLDSTGFGWLVVPNVPVATSTNGWNLRTLSIPWPVSYRGTVTVPGEAERRTVPNALIRAYIYMLHGEYTADPTKADSVLQIAETRSDESGAFQVLIPATVNPPPKE